MSVLQRISTVLIVGRDVELWLVALALVQALTPIGITVHAVELPSRRAPGEILAALPQLQALHARLGIPSEELLALTGGSLSLGQNFELAGPRHTSFFHAWDACGEPIDGHEFLHGWLRASAEGFNVPLEGFSTAAVAARSGRMVLEDAAGGELRRGCHLQAVPYAAYLKSRAVRGGVTLHLATAVSIEQNADGTMSAVRVEGGERLPAELFIDASGPQAVLSGGRAGQERPPCDPPFGANRIVTALAPAFTTPPPFAEIRTGSEGWTALHPACGATGVLHAFRGDLTPDERAVAAAEAAAGTALTQIAVRSVASCACRELWSGNCVAVGTAGAQLDPLHQFDLHVLQLGIVYLLALLPGTLTFDAERVEYNRALHAHLERLREFQSAFYALAPRIGPFWPDPAFRSTTLAHTLATFQASAYLPPQEGESLRPESWYLCLLGLGVRPERWPPTTDRIDRRRLHAELNRLLAATRAQVRAQPTYPAYLTAIARRRGGAPPAVAFSP